MPPSIPDWMMAVADLLGDALDECRHRRDTVPLVERHRVDGRHGVRSRCTGPFERLGRHDARRLVDLPVLTMEADLHVALAWTR